MTTLTWIQTILLVLLFLLGLVAPVALGVLLFRKEGRFRIIYGHEVDANSSYEQSLLKRGRQIRGLMVLCAVVFFITMLLTLRVGK